MDVREKLIELLKEADRYEFEEQKKNGDFSIEAGWKLIADHLIANGVTVQEWISVKDRLPDWRDGKVLVFTKYGFSICERTVNNRWQGQHANWITHWAYLPQPPKGVLIYDTSHLR